MFAWISSSLFEHFEGAIHVRTPDSTIAFVTSNSWWLGANSPAIFKPASLFIWISKRDCFSAAGSLLAKLVGSDVSVFTCSLIDATMRVVASKWSFLSNASWPSVGDWKTLPPKSSNCSSVGAFCGVPRVKARVLKSVTPKALNPAKRSSPPLSSLHFRSKAAALSTMLMIAKQEVG